MVDGTSELCTEGSAELLTEGISELCIEGHAELLVEGISKLCTEGISELPIEGPSEELCTEGSAELPIEGVPVGDIGNGFGSIKIVPVVLLLLLVVVVVDGDTVVAAVGAANTVVGAADVSCVTTTVGGDVGATLTGDTVIGNVVGIMILPAGRCVVGMEDDDSFEVGDEEVVIEGLLGDAVDGLDVVGGGVFLIVGGPVGGGDGGPSSSSSSSKMIGEAISFESITALLSFWCNSLTTCDADDDPTDGGCRSDVR